MTSQGAEPGCHKKCFGKSNCVVGWPDGSCGGAAIGTKRPPMDEQSWLTSDDPVEMLNEVTYGIMNGNTGEQIRKGASDRKLRLLACACCRQVWHLLTDYAPCPDCGDGGGPGMRATHDIGGSLSGNEVCETCSGTGRINRSRRAVEVAELDADGQATSGEFLKASMEATLARQQSPFYPWNEVTPDQPKDMAALAVCNLFQEHAINAATEAGRLTQFVPAEQAAYSAASSGIRGKAGDVNVIPMLDSIANGALLVQSGVDGTAALYL